LFRAKNKSFSLKIRQKPRLKMRLSPKLPKKGVLRRQVTN
jgi:hypothetical protein